MDFQGYLLEASFAIPKDRERVYPFSILADNNLRKLKLHPKVTFLVGDNGVGKSTLLEAIAIACGFNAEGGSKNFNFNTKASHSNLHDFVKLTKGYKQTKDGFFLRSETFYNVASEIDNLGGTIIDSYGGTSLHEQSHGESFWSLFINRFRGNGLYILDEPEAALSVNRQMSMLRHIDQLCKKQSQFIIVTHSPVILSYPNSIIYQFSNDTVEVVNYKQSQTYLLFKEFLNNSDYFVSTLLE